jgi:hypothetical protein
MAANGGRAMKMLLLLALTILPASAQAQDWEYFHVRVCNTGTVTFEVASAEQERTGTLQWSNDYRWVVKGWMEIKPERCSTVWNDKTWEGGFASKELPKVDLIYAFTDSKGTWGAASLQINKDSDASPSTESFCVKAGNFAYTMPQGRPSNQCESGYILMPASMHFKRPRLNLNEFSGHWEGANMSVQLVQNDRAIPAGIKPSPSDMRSHEQAPEPEPDVSGQLMKQLGKELEERQKAREAQQAEDARQARAQAEVRLKQNICLSDNITSEWRTPPAGGKMAKLKEMLIKSFGERAETASYDQTKWFLIDSRNYPTWNMVSFPYSIVSGIPGGSCPSGTHHEFLPLTP